jgi:hypothetical protein
MIAFSCTSALMNGWKLPDQEQRHVKSRFGKADEAA